MSAHPVVFSAEIASAVLSRLRAKAPRVHCITNLVAQSFTANVLLALGAVPSMTIAPEEVVGFVQSADALLVNLGMLDEARRLAIPVAVKAAYQADKPVVIDPVFVNRSPIRSDYARALLNDVPDGAALVLRANRDEVESLFPNESPAAAARARQITLAMTGAEDLVCSHRGGIGLANGHPLLSRVTATGCAGGAVMAAFLAVERDPLIAAAAALSVFNIAAEVAAEQAAGPGSLVPGLLDALYRLETADVAGRLSLVNHQSGDA